MNAATRVVRFNVVGALGVVVQLSALALLNRAFSHHYLVTSTVAVELAVLHNFAWHRKYTWPEAGPGRSNVRALVRFHVANGVVSLGGNFALMHVFVRSMHMRVLVANALAIVVCGVGNFVLAHRWVFGAGVTREKKTAGSGYCTCASKTPVSTTPACFIWMKMR